MSTNKGASLMKRSLKVCREVPPVKQNYKLVPTFTRPKVIPLSASASNLPARKCRITCSTSESNASVDEYKQIFLENWERVPVINVHSIKDVDKHLRICYNILKNKNEDWEKRVDCLRMIRSLVIAGAHRYDGFVKYLRFLLPAFQLALEDLRLKVVQEACITIAFLSKTLRNKLSQFLEPILNNIFKLMLRTQKVFVSTALACSHFILQHLQTPRLIPIIAHNLDSKSNNIRRACCQFTNLILKVWHKHTIEKCSTLIQEIIKKGISDADAESRSHSRNAYVSFAVHFPKEAEKLKDSLDYHYQRLLFSNPSCTLNHSCFDSAKFLCKGPQVTTKSKSTIATKPLPKKENFKASTFQPLISTCAMNLNQHNMMLSQEFQETKFTSAHSTLPFRQSTWPTFSAQTEESCDSNDNVLNSRSSHQKGRKTESTIHDPSVTNLSIDSDDVSYELFCANLTGDRPSALNLNDTSRSKTMEASQALLLSFFNQISKAKRKNDNQDEARDAMVLKLTRLIERYPPNTSIMRFRPALAKIMLMTLPSEPVLIREAALRLLQVIIVKKELIHLLNKFSDLVIAQVISLCADKNGEVATAAKDCALVLSKHLPTKNVMRIIVPVINLDENAYVKLICIEMLVHLIKRSDNGIIFENVNQIVPVLQGAISDDVNNTLIKEAAASCLELLFSAKNSMTK